MEFTETNVNSVKSSEEINAESDANGFHEKVDNGNLDIYLRETTADGLRKNMQEMRENVLAQVNDRINDIIAEVLQGFETSLLKREPSNKDKYRDKRQSNKEGALPDKEFLARNSLLNDLFNITDIHTIYNLFMVTLILLFFSTVANDILDEGSLLIGTMTIRKAFAKFPTCLYIWTLMQISTISVYIPFNLWAYQRLQFSPKSTTRKFWDYSFLTIFIVYMIFFIHIPVTAMLREDLGIASSLVILLEQVRQMMKSYAFVRSVAPRFISYKPHSDVPQPTGSRFSQYLYFLFAPTLIYRDKYPRTNRIRWMVVMKNFAEVGLAIFYGAFVLEHLIGPNFEMFGKQSVQLKWIVKRTIAAIIPGILTLIIGHYVLLHSWMNAWAEMLQFADRLFYKDWWNSTSCRMYHRTWNVVVHDWLYTYIYKDMYEIVMPRNKTVATLVVFLVSAAFHEYIQMFAPRFFCPVFFILFVSSGCTFLGRITVSNVFIWLSLCLASGIIVSTYTMEYFARRNCEPYFNYYLDLLVPRSWVCQVQFAS